MHRGSRQRWLSEWFMDFSVLWAVFPLLDQLLEREKGMDWQVVGFGWIMSLTTAVLGLLLQQESES
jgi:hypothetical protein